MQYRSVFSLARAATATVLALIVSLPAHAVILNAPAGPTAERVDAGVDRTTSFARHGNSRGGYTQLTGLSDFRVRVNTSPAAPVVVDLGATPVQPIVLRTPALDKAAALQTIKPAPLANVPSFPSSTAGPIVSTPATAVPVADEQTDTTETPVTDDIENQGPQVALTITEPVDVPEPGPLGLLAFGLVVMLRRRRVG